MGPLNEFQRRFLEVVQQRLYLHQANAGGPDPESFGYPAILGNGSQLTNGATVQSIITVQSDAWFLWEYISTGVVLPATGAFGDPSQVTGAGNVLLQITLPGMGDDLYHIPAGFSGVPAAITTGSSVSAAAGIPYIFPTPVLLPPNTNINISATQLGVAAGSNPVPLAFYVMLHGARIQVWS